MAEASGDPAAAAPVALTNSTLIQGVGREQDSVASNWLSNDTKCSAGKPQVPHPSSDQKGYSQTLKQGVNLNQMGVGGVHV